MDPNDTLRRVLIDARAIIQERGWSKGANARNAENEPVSFRSLEAVTFCPTGAVRLAARNRGFQPEAAEAARALLVAQIRAQGGSGSTLCLAAWNDHPNRRRRDVVDLFDRAIGALIVPSAEAAACT